MHKCRAGLRCKPWLFIHRTGQKAECGAQVGGWIQWWEWVQGFFAFFSLDCFYFLNEIASIVKSWEWGWRRRHGCLRREEKVWNSHRGVWESEWTGKHGEGFQGSNESPLRWGEEFQWDQSAWVVCFCSSHIQLLSCRGRVGGELESSGDGVLPSKYDKARGSWTVRCMHNDCNNGPWKLSWVTTEVGIWRE